MGTMGCPCGCDDCASEDVDATAIREWADRQKALGLIPVESYDVVMKCAEDLEVG